VTITAAQSYSGLSFALAAKVRLATPCGCRDAMTNHPSRSIAHLRAHCGLGARQLESLLPMTFALHARALSP